MELRSPLAVAVLAGVLALVIAFQLTRRAPARTGAGDPVAGAVYRLGAAEAERVGAPVLPQAVRDASLRFAPGVPALDRSLVLRAVEAARPEARALIAAVDGLVDLEVGEAAEGAVGSTYFGGGTERFRIVLELGPIHHVLGPRGVSRLVLHELGHVVDRAIVPGALDAQLDRGVAPCPAPGPACAPREERFAESFAKWATGDIGLALPIGYSVPPPEPTPERWGAPLVALAAQAAAP